MLRAKCWGDMLNEVGWNLIDNNEDVELHPFEVAAIQEILEDRIDVIMSKDDCNEVEKDILEIYLKLSGYVVNPNYDLRYIENRLYKVEVQKGDKIIDIVKRNPETPKIWERIVDACRQANLWIDMKSGTIC